MSKYLVEEAFRAHEARIEALSKMFEDVELQGKEMSAAMQEFDSRILTHRFFHEAPNDVFEMIFTYVSDVDDNGWGNGGLNVMRLVNKRCMRVVESVATRLTINGTVNKLPPSALKRCRGIKHIRCGFHGSLKSLEGCPIGLKSLSISNGLSLESLQPLSACKGLETLEICQARNISDISPLSSCTRLKKLTLFSSSVIDLTPISSMLLLEELHLLGLSFTDIVVLSQCRRLKILSIGGNQGIKDLSPLSQCPDLEKLVISRLSFIKDLSFLEKGFTTLNCLIINCLPVDDLNPLTKLQYLKELHLLDITETAPLLPLARCHKLKALKCDWEALDLGALREARPDIEILA